jgi:hypothetical protein
VTKPAEGNPKDIDEEVAKEWEHTMLQDSLGKELNELNKQLEKKEVWVIFLLLYSDYPCQEPYHNFSQIIRSLR